MEAIPNILCLEANSTTSGMNMISLECLYKPLFRGFVKWQMGSNEATMHDIDFEDSEGMYEGPDATLIINDPKDSMFYQCIGTNFDNEAATSVLAKFKVKILRNVTVNENGEWGRGVRNLFVQNKISSVNFMCNELLEIN